MKSREPLLNITKQPCTIVLILLVSILLCSCTPAANCQTSKLANHPATPLLQFQKTPCYGSCPAYEANIMKDGSITFIGWDNVAVDDTVQLCFTKQALQQLEKDIAALNYTSLKDAYLSDWTDKPSTYLTFYKEGNAIKRVKHQEGGPESIVKFQESLHRQLIDLIAKQVKQK